MANQIVVSAGAKVRNLNGVLTGTTGVVNSLPINAANGIPQLDVNGKILVSQLPNSVMEYLGTWNATTNTPTLVNGTGNQGDVYLCNVAGTVDFGAGPIAFVVGDQVIYSGSIWQRASGSTGTVTSVGITESGDSLNITGSPITTSGTINIGFNGTNLQYVNGAGNLTTFPTLITSIGLTMPSAFSVANSPLTANGTIAVTGAGTTAQYIRGDGSLATFPTIASEAQRLITEVYNSTGATLTKGTVVYINGGQGNLPTVTKAIATGDATSAQTYGIVQTDITNMNNGNVVVIGSLMDLDTQAYAAGTQLYLSSTTAGAWTSTKQYAPAHLVYVGIVVRSHPTQGVVEVRIQNGFEMDELHNVSAQSPSNNQGLFYNTSTSLWENKSIATALGYTPADDSLVVHLAGTETITGAKTFTAALVGATATFTNGGSGIGVGITLSGASGDGLKITHSAGRALNIASSGAGYGIIINNDTGSTSAPFTIQKQGSNVITMSDTGAANFTGQLTLGSTITNGSSTYTLPSATGTLALTSAIPTNPVGGTGTTNYLPKFTGASTIGNSLVYDDGTNVGIGTATPAAKIESVATTSGAGGWFMAGQFTAAQYPMIRLAATTPNKYSGLGNDGDGSLQFFVNGNNGAVGTTAAIINPSGNLGLGVTPSAWNVGKAMQIGSLDGVSIWGYSGSAQFGNNFYWNGGFLYSTSAEATRYAQGSGAHQWFTAPSGTAGNAITFTQAMTLTASGRLLIGTPTEATYMLDVNGTGRFVTSLRTSDIYVQSGSSGGYVSLRSGGAGAAGYMEIYSNNGTTRLGYIGYGTTNITYIAENSAIHAFTGAATFTSTVSASGTISIQRPSSGATLLSLNGSSAYGDTSTINFCDGRSYIKSTILVTANGNTDLSFATYNGTSVAQRLYIADSGAATFSSSVTATSFFESSDSRLKTLIQDNYQTKGIASITPKLYTKNGKVELGYYAQDFVGVLDSAVSKGSDDMLSLSYREVLVAKVYALEQRIKELENK